MPRRPKTSANVLVLLSGVGLLACYHWLFLAYFPAPNGNIGHDYSLFLPQLLDGYHWYLHNGALTPPWFSAAFCGGIPAFANPQYLYYSVPQWLTFGVDPLTAVYLTLLIFAALGLSGFYRLLRESFQTSRGTALFGATLFLYNGFFASRLLVGHLTYHAFMLLPWIAVCLLRRQHNVWTSLWQVALAGLLLSYIVYTGVVHLLLPGMVILVFIGVLHGVMRGGRLAFWRQLLGAGALSIAISLPRLVAAMAYIGNFERSSYKLPGAKSVWGLLVLTFEALFLQPSEATIQAVMTNLQWEMERHELEYGVTLVPLCFLALGAVYAACQLVRQPRRCSASWPWLALSVLGLILLMPLALNYYHPAWHAFLKQTPILRNSSTLIRWFSIYIPLIILMAALCLEHMTALARLRPYLSALGIGAVLLIWATTDRAYYTTPPYSPENILHGYEQAKKSGKPPRINEVVVFRDTQGRVQLPVYKNDTLVNGGSQLLCYEPIFGYRLEAFPMKPLHPGRVDQVDNGLLNLKNPACYVYPEANHCRPGDHFTVNQRQEMEAFVTYKPFTFAMPVLQHVSNVLSVGVLLLVGLFGLAYPLWGEGQRRALMSGKQRNQWPEGNHPEHEC